MKKTFAVVVAALLALTGCSSDAADDERAAAEAVEDFMNAMLEGNGEVVCGISLRQGEIVTADDPAWQPCLDSVTTLSGIIGADYDGTTIHVKKATVTGDTAVVLADDIEGDIFHGATAKFELRKIDSKWYLDPPN